MSEPLTDSVSEDLVLSTADALLGDIAGFLIDRLKRQRKPWQQMTATEQELEIEAAARIAKALVTSTVSMIAADGRTVIRGVLNQFQIKGPIKAVVEIAATYENKHRIVDAAGTEVMLVVSDADAYLGGEMPRPEPDQGDFLGEGDAEFPEVGDEPVADNAPATADDEIVLEGSAKRRRRKRRQPLSLH